jgi:hypothetical protein
MMSLLLASENLRAPRTRCVFADTGSAVLRLTLPLPALPASHATRAQVS